MERPQDEIVFNDKDVVINSFARRRKEEEEEEERHLVIKESSDFKVLLQQTLSLVKFATKIDLDNWMDGRLGIAHSLLVPFKIPVQSLTRTLDA